MKKRFSPKQLLPSKKVIMAIAAAACVTAFSIGGVHYYNTNLKETATTATYYNQYLAASGADEVITDQVKDYISNYFQTMNVKEFISQDEMAQIIAQISTGVMNRLPTDTLSSGQELKVKEMISKAVIEAANDNNNQATDNTGANATVITEELQSYIKTTIVPNITAEIQINQGAIDDLKKSLADLSEKYKGNQKEYDALIDSISSKLGKLDKNGATNDDVANLKKDLEKLSKVLGDYKSSSSSDVTDVSKELEAAKKDLQSKIDKYTEVSDEQFTQIKDNLKESINQRDDLLADQKTQIINMIDSAQSDNVTSLADAKKELLKQINSVDASQSAALQDAIDDLTTGTITDLINTVAKNKNDQDQINVETDEKINDLTKVTSDQFDSMKTSLMDQINQNKQLSDADKAALEIKLNEASSDNVKNLADAKKELLKQINSVDASQSAALQDAIDDLTTGTITDLINTVAKNKNDQDQINVETDEKINDLTKVTSDQFDSMKTSLMDQINQNKQLSDADKAALEIKLNEASSDNVKNLADAKKELQNAIASANTSQTDALNNAINNLTNGTITDLSNSVNQNKAAQDAVNTSVQTSIDVINNQLNGCTIEYIDGHFYVTHDKGGADPVSKKLDYAQ